MYDYLTKAEIIIRHPGKKEALEFNNKVRNNAYYPEELELHGVSDNPSQCCGIIIKKDVCYDEDGIEYVKYDGDREKNKYNQNITQDDRIEIDDIPYMIIVYKNKSINLYSNITTEYYFDENLKDLQELKHYLQDNNSNYRIISYN